VKCITAGEAPYVPLSEIQAKIPELWRSLCSAVSARRMVQNALDARINLGEGDGRAQL